MSKFDASLPPHQQEFREFYAGPRLVKWMGDVLPSLGSTWKIELSPLEQLDAFMAVYASGDTLTYQYSFKPLTNLGDGIWQLKTADLRMFGWFHVQDCFVGGVGDTADRIKLHGLYAGYVGEAVRFRDALDLDEPKFVPGDNPNAVVSNFDYP